MPRGDLFAVAIAWDITKNTTDADSALDGLRNDSFSVRSGTSVNACADSPACMESREPIFAGNDAVSAVFETIRSKPEFCRVRAFAYVDLNWDIGGWLRFNGQLCA